MSKDSKIEQIEVPYKKIKRNMPMWSNKLSEFERIRTEPNTLASSRVSRTRGIACSVCFEQPLRERLVLVVGLCVIYCHFIP